ncbi:MAG: acetate--CoA ligase family protein [Thermoleophilia bacterium]
MGGGRLTPLFFPNSVAVVGASREPSKVGHVIMANLIAGGYKGSILPVNPKARRILGRKCFPTVEAAGASLAAGASRRAGDSRSTSSRPANVDLAVIAIPATLVPEIIEDCGRAGVGAAIVISSGFRETGKEGMLLEKQLVAAARRHRIALLGPNCLGLICSQSLLNATFARSMPSPGGIALMSQSGALCTSILDWSARERAGFSRFVSMGNEADVNEADLLSDWRGDDGITVVAAYLEQVSDGQRFLSEARRISKKKPFVMLKAGVTDAGARASSSHTGSLAGSEKAYVAAARQTNSLMAGSMEELFDLIDLAAKQPLPRKAGVAIVTNAGGPGILAADACEKADLAPASFSSRTIKKLREALPAAAAVYNPVDLMGDAAAGRFRDALDIIAADRGVGSIVVLLSPQAVTDIEGTAAEIVEHSRSSRIPVAACFLGGKDVESGFEVLRRGGVPAFPFPERAVRALADLTRYALRRRERFEEPNAFRVNHGSVKRIFEAARRDGQLHIGGLQALEIFKVYGLKVPAGRLAHNSSEAAEIGREIGFPVVMKAVSPGLMHKSDVGGVRVGVTSAAAARRAFEEIDASVEAHLPGALLTGVAVQQQIEGAREVIIGSSRDPQFGPLLMFGLGGIYVEVMKDVSFRIAPIGGAEARSMLTEIKSFPLLAGSRGERPADIDAIIDAILRCSQLVTDFPEIVELDINPLLVREKARGGAGSGGKGRGGAGNDGREGGAWAADARLVIKP